MYICLFHMLLRRRLQAHVCLASDIFHSSWKFLKIVAIHFQTKCITVLRYTFRQGVSPCGDRSDTLPNQVYHGSLFPYKDLASPGWWMHAVIIPVWTTFLQTSFEEQAAPFLLKWFVVYLRASIKHACLISFSVNHSANQESVQSCMEKETRRKESKKIQAAAHDT